MKQLNDEQRILSMKQEAENGLVIGDEIGMRDALEQILREADEHLGITGEAPPAEQTMAVWGDDLRKCRDCPDFGPICPNSGKPCGGDQPAILKKQAS